MLFRSGWHLLPLEQGVDGEVTGSILYGCELVLPVIQKHIDGFLIFYRLLAVIGIWNILIGISILVNTLLESLISCLCDQVVCLDTKRLSTRIGSLICTLVLCLSIRVHQAEC